MIERNTFIPFGNTADHSIDFLLGVKEDARTTTLQRIENLPTEELYWQYAEGWNTIGALLSHIISVDECFPIFFIENRELTNEEKERLSPGLEMGKYIPDLIANDPIDVYLERLEIAKQKSDKAIRELDQHSFFEKLDAYNEKTGANRAWIMYHAVEDEVHHRGQISILRKLYKSIKG